MSVIPADLEFPLHRTAEEPPLGLQLPPDTMVVSADGHWTLTEDILYDNLPARVRDKAPRIWFENGVGHVGMNGKSWIPVSHQETAAIADALPGCTQLEPRLRDLAREGVEKEIVFAGAFHMVMRAADFEIRDSCLRIYNEYMASIAKQAPERFYPVGYTNYWDPAEAVNSVQQLVDLGIKVTSIPQFPTTDADGKPIRYAWPEMDTFWSALADAGIVVAFHVGESASEGPGGVGATILQAFGPMRKVFGELIFGGVLDRHPKLKVVFTEAGIAWVASALQDAEMIVDSFGSLCRPMLRERPSYYWKTNMWATFITDEVGLRLLDVLGADRVMWGPDYPHPESTFGYGWSATQPILDATTPDQARMILGRTAIDVYGLN